MKAIIKYQADDGAEFTTEEAALDHDQLCVEVGNIIGNLPALPANDGCSFVNGSGYIQHLPELYWRAYRELLQVADRLTMKHGGFPAIKKAIGLPMAVHVSHVERVVSECCPNVVWKALHRFTCTDAATLREYGQPYYASHPEEAPSNCLNL